MTRPIRTLLIANRGEIALRIAAVCREYGIRSVAVYSEPDRDLPHVRAADVAIPLGGRTPAESYLDAGKLLAAAARAGADAIHPGYGFLSENPDFAQSVIDEGLVWVGPTPASMRSMALKVQARRIAEAAGVPVVPGAELVGDVSDDTLLATGAAIGYPLLVKASAGGGGRGMRVVAAAAELAESVESARREAASAFGDGTVFLERYLTDCRHVEVQVFGDMRGNVIHVGDRECSVQRRHQKVIEEAPSPGITDDVRSSMHAAAVSLAGSIDYVGAGTVEFVVVGEGDDQRYYFLEMNTRLQVEHPVTEWSHGVDLIPWQFAVAQGEPLPLEQEEIEPYSAAIEVRLYAEDPARDFAPGSGVLRTFELAGGQIRIDAGYESGSTISTFYDPMLAKVIAEADSREEAALTLARALRAAVIHGPVTNRDMLVAVLESQDFLAGRTFTSFLDEHPGLLAPDIPPSRRELHLAAAVIAAAHAERESLRSAPAATTGFAPSGWRNVAAVPQTRSFDLGDGEITVAYALERDGTWRVGVVGGMAAQVGVGDVAWFGAPLRAAVSGSGDDVVVDLEGEERIFARVIRSESLVTVHDGLWNSRLVELPRFRGAADDEVAGGSVTPVPGTVTVVAVAVGDAVVAGQTLVVLEAMKMEHRIVAAADGVVSAVLVEVDQSVDAHAVVVTVEAVDG